MDSDDDEFWDEPMGDDQIITCLFCDNSFQTISALWEHCKDTHEFDITFVKQKFRLDFYGFVKMVNYIRTKKVKCEKWSEFLHPDLWEDEKYLQPVIQDDALLQYDFEDSECEEEEKNVQGASLKNGGANCDRDEMNTRLYAALERAKEAESALQQAVADLETMREVVYFRAGVHELVLGSQKEKAREEAASDETGIDDNEDSYFTSYSHYSIHEEMLKDKVRTLSYKNFMQRNRHIFEDKIVLDIGCGSGILSIFAAQSGAKKVIGVDKSSILYHAMDIVRENKLDNIVTLKRGKVEEIDLDLKQVDVIISEWMGYFLLFESMLDTVLFARDKWLAPDGKVYPDRCTMSIVGVEDKKRMEEKVAFWEDVYGIKMSCMKSLVLAEPLVDIVDPNTTLTSSCIVKEINVNNVTIKELDFESDFQLQGSRNGTLNIIVGYFDIIFEDNCTEKISFSTRPSSPSTHWKQTLFYLESPISLKEGDILNGSLLCKKNEKDARSLDVVLKIRDNTSKEVITNNYTLQ